MNKSALRILLISAGLLAVFFLSACGKKEVKPVSQESKLAQEAFELAETVKNAYLADDGTKLEKLCTDDGYRQLFSGRKKFDKAEITFTPTWVEIKDSLVHLSVSWKGTWTVENKSREDRGLGIFIFEGSPLKLAGVQRDNPFRLPE